MTSWPSVTADWRHVPQHLHHPRAAWSACGLWCKWWSLDVSLHLLQLPQQQWPVQLSASMCVGMHNFGFCPVCLFPPFCVAWWHFHNLKKYFNLCLVNTKRVYTSPFWALWERARERLREFVGMSASVANFSNYQLAKVTWTVDSHAASILNIYS